MSRNEKLLKTLINGESIVNYEPKSRIENLLKSCCLGEMPTQEPKSRIEKLLYALAEKLATEEYDGTIEVV